LRSWVRAPRVGFTRGLLGWLGHAEESEALPWAIYTLLRSAVIVGFRCCARLIRVGCWRIRPMRVSAVRALWVTAVSLWDPLNLRAPEPLGAGMRSVLVKPRISLIISGIREWIAASTIFFAAASALTETREGNRLR